jgi:hypothetical protein
MKGPPSWIRQKALAEADFAVARCEHCPTADRYGPHRLGACSLCVAKALTPLLAALDDVAMAVSYIVVHTGGAPQIHPDAEGPRVAGLTVEDVGGVIHFIGDTARKALALTDVLAAPPAGRKG